MRKRPAAILGTVVTIVLVYGASLLGYHWLSGPPYQLAAPDLDEGHATVVVIHLEQLSTSPDRLSATLRIYPDQGLLDRSLDLLATDVAVKLATSTELQEVLFQAGQAPVGAATTLAAEGDTADWPFDVYSTEPVSVELIAGSGSARHRLPARVEVTGRIDGWIIRQVPQGISNGPAGATRPIVLSVERTRASLAFDLGVCLVLVTLPAMALFVAIETVRGRKRFHPPLTTWFAAMLFAVVPLRNILPGAPPAGAWIDQIVVIWVLIALVGAMLVYVAAWWRQSE